MRRAGILAVAVVFSACVHVDTEETRRVDPHRFARQRLDRLLRSEEVGGLQIRSLVYKPTVLPLEDFLERLSHGDLTSAFRSIHLRYDPSNVDDAVIRTVLSKGFVPVLVYVTNSGSEPAELEGLRLTLQDDLRSLEPIPNADLPTAFDRISPAAVAANAYNTAVVVAGAAVFISAVAAAIWQEGKGRDMGGAYNFLGDMAGNFGGDVYNPVNKTTRMDYGDLLWSPRRLAPGSSVRGLLFFPAKGVDWTALRLKADFAR